jgi:hypothetical protein
MSAWAQLPSALRVWATHGADDEESGDTAQRLADEAGLRVVVLVEGVSDAQAVAATAERRLRDMSAEGVCVVPMDGATNIGRYLALLGADRLDVRVAGLYDAAEEPFFSRALAVNGLLTAPSRQALASRGFFACVADLEEELIRAVGVAGVEAVIQARGDGRRLDTFRRQAAQRDRSPEQQLRRFMGTTSGRKTHYARALVESLDPSSLPPPLLRLLAACT